MVSEAASEHAARCRELAAELSRAAEHLKIAAEHLEQGQIPRYAAHNFAALGEVVKAHRGLEELAIIQAERSPLSP